MLVSGVAPSLSASAGASRTVAVLGAPRLLHRRYGMAAIGLCLLALVPARARADAFLEPSFDLRPGWNLIHVPVEPVDKDPVTALAAIAWESLWTWLPSEGAPRGGRWLVRYNNAPAFLNAFTEADGTSSLFSFTGPASYLILSPTGGTLRIRGVVRAESRALAGDAYQLFGPRFDAARPPSLASYFSRLGVREHIGPVFEIAGQTYRELAAGDALREGAAYWVFPDQAIPAPDPVRLRSGLSGLRFDAQTSVQELVLDVGATGALAGNGGGQGVASRQLELRALPSAGNASATDWLELLQPDGDFAPIGAATLVDVAPDQSIVRLSFRARRDGVSALGAPDPAAILEVTSAQGAVTVGAELDIPSLRGMWIGDAAVTEVERPSFHGGGFAPAPAVSVALILEIPTAGQPRLLPCVTVESSRDGQRVSYRLEAALFPESVALAGTIGSDGTTGNLVGTMIMSPEHPLNPHRHRYHPEHGSGYEVTRSFRLRFGADLPGEPPAGADLDPFLSVGLLSGVYEEEILGLSQEPIRVRGTFRLRRLSAGSPGACTAGNN